ncbi:MAG: dihydrolipoyl dehydrogenase [Chloroflexi bacterium]|nr:dihydrolipoyl dehydrogenase [Chloroflexota bacterium]
MSNANKTYDVVIIGGGPGGYVAAIRAGQLGLHVALVEKESTLGGVCLNWGCIPTKALLKNAEVLAYMQDAARWGIAFDNLRVDWGAAISRSRQVVKRLTTGVASLMKKNKVDVYSDEAELDTATSILLKKSGQKLSTKNIIIATGSSANTFGFAVDGKRVITSNEAVVIKDVPKRILIMGAGAVGTEFASIFRTYGSDVTLIEMLGHILPPEDDEIADLLAKEFTRQGVKLLMSTKVESITPSDTGVTVQVTAPDGAKTLEGDVILLAAGRSPNSKGLGLEKVGVKVERGFIVSDGQQRTNVPGIYAIGDVTKPPLLAHKAMREGEIAAEVIAGRSPKPLDINLIPHPTYCTPQVASIGLTEQQAKAQGFKIKIGRFPYRAIGKALAINEYEGQVKLVIEEQYGEILGAHIIGPDATEGIHEIGLAKSAELTTAEVSQAIHAHPTLAEAMGEAALAVDGHAIHI